MKVLLTGDTGFVGKNMKNFLINQGHEVTGYSKSDGFDVLNIEQLKERMKGNDYVVHLASEAKPAQSVLFPTRTLDENIKGTLNILEVSREFNIPLIYPSSCEIYGNSKIPIKEDFPIKASNPYAASKGCCDVICYMYWKCYDTDVRIVRYFNPYGPFQQLNKVIPVFYKQAKSNELLTVFGDGNDFRDYVFIDDIIKGTWESRRASKGTIFNLATGIKTTTKEIAKMLIEYFDSKSKIDFVDYPKEFGGIKYQVGDSTKAKETIDWQAKTPLKKGLEITIQWLETVKNN